MKVITIPNINVREMNTGKLICDYVSIRECAGVNYVLPVEKVATGGDTVVCPSGPW
jgi:hypothetical protein